MRQTTYLPLRQTPWTRILLVSIATSLLLSVPGKSYAQPHTPDQILRILEESDLLYEISVDNEIPAETPNPTLLPGLYVFENDKNERSLRQRFPTAETLPVLFQAGLAFANKDHKAALRHYRRVLVLDPEYHPALTLLGNVLYSSGEYRSAKIHFERAIKKNFADYQAHWFLSSANRRLGDQKEALKNLTTAHILNVHHSSLRTSLQKNREALGKPWKQWGHSPRFRLEKAGQIIRVAAHETWVGYAMAKALHRYEPGFSEQTPRTTHLDLQEERDALIMLVSGESEYAARVRSIVKDGYLDEFVSYEIVAMRHPQAIALLTPKEIYRIAEYIDRYH